MKALAKWSHCPAMEHKKIYSTVSGLRLFCQRVKEALIPKTAD